MSTKFEQLLDLIVNEEMDKANELFHEIVVEKSRDIYENLIAEEADEESVEESDEEQDESVEESDEEQDESVEEEMDLEDSYAMGEEEEDDLDVGPKASGDEATDDFGADIGATDDTASLDDEASEEEAILNIKSAIDELEAAFAELEQATGMDGDSDAGVDDFGDTPDADSDMDMDSDEMQMGKPAFEGRRVTREYVEKVGNDWDKGNSMKSQGQYVGAGTGEKDGAPQEGRSPISSGSGKPNTGANSKNIAQGASESAPDGQRPTGKAGGLVKNPQTMTTGNQNVPGGKVSVKGLSKVAGGHGAEKKGAGPGPVGSGTGDKAGQTSISSDRPFLKKL